MHSVDITYQRSQRN